VVRNVCSSQLPLKVSAMAAVVSVVLFILNLLL
jgi:hypothetical protein